MRSEDSKECSRCGVTKPLSEFYSQNKKRKDGTPYIYYSPYCKECAIKKSTQWINENKERFENNRQKYVESEKHKIRSRRYSKTETFKRNYRRWQKENKDKIKEYNQKSNAKRHTINENEWDNCKNYFNYCCAYCGISEVEAVRIYKQQLHKDHAFHDGSSGLENCIPACKSCNSSKRTDYYYDWYRPELQIYDQSKMLKIKSWLEEDCYDYKEEHSN